jgi:uncharacterized protein YndB with AHSA1/START domain
MIVLCPVRGGHRHDGKLLAMDDTVPTENSPVHGSATVRVAASPADVFALLTDLDRLPQLSPENQRCELLPGATEVAVGARFRGTNRAGEYEWQADCEVTVFEPDRRFAYLVPPEFEHATEWSYTIVPDGDGSIVTEAFHAPMLGRPDIYPGKIEGRRDNLERACRTTMANLKATLES